jgi:hypothetical protein
MAAIAAAAAVRDRLPLRAPAETGARLRLAPGTRT